MENENKSDKNYTSCWILYTLISGVAWIALLIAKACGAIGMKWPVVILAGVWIPTLLLLIMITAAVVLALFKKAARKAREWKHRRKVARVLWDAMHGLTLNNIGPIYGTIRKPGEPNKEYERRIMKAARTVDKVNLAAPLEAPHTPATGLKLEAIAAKHGLERRPGESDEALQERIRTAVIEKLERRTKNGV